MKDRRIQPAMGLPNEAQRHVKVPQENFCVKIMSTKYRRKKHRKVWYILSTRGIGIDRLENKTTALDPKSRRHNKDGIP
jgi:hypothetical protein